MFIALDLTTVARTSVLFYAMPVWMALGAHLFLPGDRLTAPRVAGLARSVSGVALAILGRSEGVGSLWGDLAAIGAAMGWAAAGLMVKASSLKTIRPEMQLMWQVAVSAPILLLLAPLYGELVRDLQPIDLAGPAFQTVVVVSAGFILWFWLMSIYPASGVASFSFLAPVFGVALGWWLLDEPVTLVASGIVLINRPAKRAPPG